MFLDIIRSSTIELTRLKGKRSLRSSNNKNAIFYASNKNYCLFVSRCRFHTFYSAVSEHAQVHHVFLLTIVETSYSGKKFGGDL